MSWLITGSSGQLGTALTQELSSRGLPFTAAVSRDLDITQNPLVQKFVGQLAPNVIINCAAWTDVDGAESNEELAARVNSAGAENLAIAAKNCGAKLIHVSTDYVFSGNTHEPWQEDSLKIPQSSYGRTKADGEDRVLRAYPENSVIIRTAWLYSPWGKNFAKTMTRLALDGKSEVRVVKDQNGQPTSATDLANQIVSLALSQTTSGIFHGTNSGEATWFDFAQEVFKLVDKDLNRVVPVSSEEYPQKANRPSFSVLSHDAWKKTTVEPMRDWRHALADRMPEIISAVKTLG
jgi:dTDP-4-dehydrorhamnose reductase